MKRISCDVDADGVERAHVHAADLDVLDATLAQRAQRPLAGKDAPLRPDRAVELVLDLQQRRGELAVVLAVEHADRLVGRIGLGERAVQRGRVAREAVEAHRQRRLGIALVPQAPHAQRGAVRRDQRPGFPGAELVRVVADEGAAHRGGRAEQDQQQPRVAAEVADQREVAPVLVGVGRPRVPVGPLEHRPRLPRGSEKL